MRKAYAAEIRGHRLRREMIATSLSNRIVNRPVGLRQMQRRCGSSARWSIARNLLPPPVLPCWHKLPVRPAP
jgi:NAD-specific glutamate dehydrogenase